MLATPILIAIILLALAGAALVGIGLRGRSTDAHPVCRRCGFGLLGRFPWTAPTCPTCPDCGQLLIEFRSVRPGAKALRRRHLACGCMLCFPAAVIGLAIAADSFAGGATAAIKPTSVMTAQLAGGTKSTPTLRRLTSRISLGSATGAEVQPVIERALVLQADRTRPVDADWLDLLEVARRKGQLSMAQSERYFRNAVDFELLARASAPRDRLTFALQGTADRLAATDKPLVITLSARSGSLDQKPLSVAAKVSGAALSPGTFFEVVSTGSHTVGDVGQTGLTIDWDVEVREESERGALLATWLQRTAADARVTASANEPHEKVLIDERRFAAPMQRAFAGCHVLLERDGDACWASLRVEAGKLPLDLVAHFRLTMESGKQYGSQELVSFTPSDPRWTGILAADPARSPFTARVRLDGMPSAGSATLELIPAPDDAVSRTLARHVWAGGTIKVEHVDVRWNEPVKTPRP